jgi:hypothetical protein
MVDDILARRCLDKDDERKEQECREQLQEDVIYGRTKRKAPGGRKQASDGVVVCERGVRCVCAGLQQSR